MRVTVCSRTRFRPSKLPTCAKIHVFTDVKAAGLDYLELRKEIRCSDAMACGSGAAGSAPDVRHQPPAISGISHLFAVRTKLGTGISLD